MKKINLLTPLMGLIATTSVALPLASCGGNNEHYPTIVDKDANLDITIPKIELNKQLVITCTPKTGYDVDLESIIVKVDGEVLPQKKDYDVTSTNNVGCTITIHADKVTSYDIKVTVKSKVEKPTLQSLEMTKLPEEDFEKGGYLTIDDIEVTAKYSDGTFAILNCEELDGYYIYVEDKEAEAGYSQIEDFASLGYTFTLADQKAGSKDFFAVHFDQDETYKYIKFTLNGADIASTLDVKCNIDKFEQGTTIKASDIVVTANHTHSEPVVLESDKVDGYYALQQIVDSPTEHHYELIQDFANTGYTFTLDDQKQGSKTLWVGHYINNDEEYIYKKFTIEAYDLPVYKGLTATSNLSTATAGDKITTDNLTVTASYLYKGGTVTKEKSWGENGYQVYSKGSDTPISDFGTNGYTFTAEDLALGKKEFTIKYTEGTVTFSFDITIKMIATYDMSYNLTWFGYTTTDSLSITKGEYLFKITYDGTNNFQNFGLATSASSYITWISKSTYKAYYTPAGSTTKEDITSLCSIDPDVERIKLPQESGATTGCVITIELTVNEDLGTGIYPYARKNS